MTRLKHFLRLNYGDALAVDTRREGDVMVYGSNGGVGFHDIANTRGPAIIVGRKGSHGKVTWTSKPSFCIDTAYYVDERHCSGNLRFAFYLLNSLELDRNTRDTGVPGLERNEAHNRRVWLPDLATQKAIADFLDRETTRIDQLIEKKQRLMEVLESRFDTMVRNAVTSGYPHSARITVSSGVDYLGNVPGHWSVERVGWRYSVQLGKMLDAAKQTGTCPRHYLRVADVQWDAVNIFDLPMMDFSSADQKKFELRPGDLLVNEGGSYVGRSAIWRGELDHCFYQKALHRLRPHIPTRDTSEFFLWVMWFATKNGVFVANGNQTTIDHLTAEAFRNYRFAFPPFDEQRMIAQHLRLEREKASTAIERVKTSVECLREFRAALITSAVTGRIDVATWGKRGQVDRQLDKIQEAARA